MPLNPLLPLRIPRLLLRIDMPDYVIRQPDDFIPRPLGHFGESFRLGLVFEGVAGEIDA